MTRTFLSGFLPKLLFPLTTAQLGALTTTGTVVNSISAAELARMQLNNLGSVLAGVPGAPTSASGASGAVTSLFLRGANSNQTLFLVDGLRLNDPNTDYAVFAPTGERIVFAGQGFQFVADGEQRVECAPALVRGTQRPVTLRRGWMGDAQVFIRTATCNMDVAAFFTKWMTDVTDAQTADGVGLDPARAAS